MNLKPGDLLQIVSMGAYVYMDDDETKRAPTINRNEHVIFLGHTKYDNGSWELYVLSPKGIGWVWASHVVTWDLSWQWHSDFSKYEQKHDQEKYIHEFVNPTTL